MNKGSLGERKKANKPKQRSLKAQSKIREILGDSRGLFYFITFTFLNKHDNKKILNLKMCVPTIPLSKHPLILSFLHHTYYWIDNRIPPPLDISLETYEKLMREHPKWERCLSILPGYKREYFNKSGNKRIVVLCHKDFIKIAYCEDKNCKLIVYDLKCPQCEQRKIVPERSNTYVSFQNGKTEERFRIHFLCGHIVEGVIDEKTRQFSFKNLKTIFSDGLFLKNLFIFLFFYFFYNLFKDFRMVSSKIS